MSTATTDVVYTAAPAAPFVLTAVLVHKTGYEEVLPGPTELWDEDNRPGIFAQTKAIIRLSPRKDAVTTCALLARVTTAANPAEMPRTFIVCEPRKAQAFLTLPVEEQPPTFDWDAVQGMVEPRIKGQWNPCWMKDVDAHLHLSFAALDQQGKHDEMRAMLAGSSADFLWFYMRITSLHYKWTLPEAARPPPPHLTIEEMVRAEEEDRKAAREAWKEIERLGRRGARPKPSPIPQWEARYYLVAPGSEYQPGLVDEENDIGSVLLHDNKDVLVKDACVELVKKKGWMRRLEKWSVLAYVGQSKESGGLGAGHQPDSMVLWKPEWVERFGAPWEQHADEPEIEELD